jgi:hypothetical protein
MKKLLTVLLIAAALFSEILTADESPLYPDWVWINSAWVYTGTDPFSAMRHPPLDYLAIRHKSS